MIYALTRFWTAKNLKTLIVVPTTSLVEQMYQDFKEYGWNVKQYCHRVRGGIEPSTDKDVTITTWQSVYKLPRQYFADFGAIIGLSLIHI